jgi:hypothetical protein
MNEGLLFAPFFSTHFPFHLFVRPVVSSFHFSIFLSYLYLFTSVIPIYFTFLSADRIMKNVLRCYVLFTRVTRKSKRYPLLVTPSSGIIENFTPVSAQSDRHQSKHQRSYIQELGKRFIYHPLCFDRKSETYSYRFRVI